MNTTSNNITISTNGLTKLYGRRVILNRLDMEIAEGESIAIIGPNGAGKTTLLRCLAAICRPSEGEVYWFGQPAGASVEGRRLLGMVAHDGLLYPHLTVGENLLFAARMCDVQKPDERVDELIRTAGLEQHVFYLARKLSRGMRQRLSIVRSLIHDPAILILDEPFASLDAAGIKWLGELLGDLRGRGRTICFTTHDRAIAHACADRILILDCGSLRELAEVVEKESRSNLTLVKAA